MGNATAYDGLKVIIIMVHIATSIAETSDTPQQRDLAEMETSATQACRLSIVYREVKAKRTRCPRQVLVVLHSCRLSNVDISFHRIFTRFCPERPAS